MPAHLAHPARRRSRSAARPLAVPALLLVAAGLVAAVSAAWAEPPPPADLERELRAQIDAMVEGGMPPDHPKVALLEEQLHALEAGRGAPDRPEAGVDTGARLAEAEAAVRAQARAEAAGRGGRGAVAPGEGPRWESGPVECEPVPGMLTVDELSGATCLSVPQPDGTGRYVAVAADGTVRSVRFGTDGEVRRLPDTALPARPAAGAALTPTAEGDLRVTPPGGPPATVDLP